MSSDTTVREATRSKRVAFRTFGCKLNLYESAGIGQQAEARGFQLQEDHAQDPADILVVNTCSVTMRADQEARQHIRKVHRKHPHTQIVVTGCYAQRAPEELATLPGVAMVVGHAEKDQLGSLLNSLPAPGAPAEVRVAPIDQKNMPTLRAHGHQGRTRAFLRVQDGCDAACTYCIIPKTRGLSHSLDFKEAVEEGRRLIVDAGFREIVLTGTHLGHFGIDNDRRRRLSELVEALIDLRAPHGFRIRLSSVEPQEIDQKLIDMFATRPELAAHLHLPLQSGSDAVLRRMRRAYRTGNYRKQVERVASSVSPLALGADLIVGFPGETEADFRRTLQFLAELPFTHLHPFTYSPRPGTPAATWPGKPSGTISTRRLAQAKALIAHKNLVFRQHIQRTRARVLVEDVSADGMAHGFCDHYIRVTFKGTPELIGRFALVRRGRITDHGMDGELLEVLP